GKPKNSSHEYDAARSTRPSISRRHSDTAICGTTPKSRTGQFVTARCPGGSFGIPCRFVGPLPRGSPAKSPLPAFACFRANFSLRSGSGATGFFSVMSDSYHAGRHVAGVRRAPPCCGKVGEWRTLGLRLWFRAASAVHHVHASRIVGSAGSGAGVGDVGCAGGERERRRRARYGGRFVGARPAKPPHAVAQTRFERGARGDGAELRRNLPRQSRRGE